MDFEGFKRRFLQMQALTNPRYFLPNSAEVEEHLRNKTRPDIVNACVRQGMAGSVDDIIPPPFRMAAIAPVNVPIVFLMLVTPASAMGATMGLHWINQTYNSACNYFNRAGDSLTMEALGQSYVAASASAMGMAWGLGKLLNRGPPVLRTLPWLIPAVASASAGSSNLLFMRMNEITDGAPVMTPDGRIVGNSKTAGFDAVARTAIGRCCMVPVSVLVVPSLAMSFFRPMKVVQANPRLAVLIELGCVTGSLMVALPAALAVFPPMMRYRPDELEPEFQALKDTNGQPYEYFEASKGM